MRAVRCALLGLVSCSPSPARDPMVVTESVPHSEPGTSPEARASEQAAQDNECDVTSAVSARRGIPPADWRARWSEVDEPRTQTRTTLDAIAPWPDGGFAGIVSCEAHQGTSRPRQQSAFRTDAVGTVTWVREIGWAAPDGATHREWIDVTVRPASGEGLPPLLVVAGTYSAGGHADTAVSGRAELWIAPEATGRTIQSPCFGYGGWEPFYEADAILVVNGWSSWLFEPGELQSSLRLEPGAIVVSQVPPAERRLEWKGGAFEPDCDP